MNISKFDKEQLEILFYNASTKNGRQYQKSCLRHKGKAFSVSIENDMIENICKDKFKEGRVCISLKDEVLNKVFKQVDKYMLDNREEILGDEKKDDKYELKKLNSKFISAEVLEGSIKKPIEKIKIHFGDMWAYDKIMKYGIKVNCEIINKQKEEKDD